MSTPSSWPGRSDILCDVTIKVLDGLGGELVGGGVMGTKELSIRVTKKEGRLQARKAVHVDEGGRVTAAFERRRLAAQACACARCRAGVHLESWKADWKSNSRRVDGEHGAYACKGGDAPCI